MTEAAPSEPPPARGRRRWRQWLGEGLLLVAIVAAVGFWQTRHVPAGPAPEFSGPLASPGEPHSTLSLSRFRAQHADRAVAIWFWAEWCPVCKLNEGSIDGLRSDYPVLTVAMQSGDAAAVARHLAARGLEWPAVADESGAIAARYGLSGVPAFIVVDRAGKIRFAEQGYTSGFGMRWRMAWASNAG